MMAWPVASFGSHGRNLARGNLTRARQFRGLLSIIRDVNTLRAGSMDDRQILQMAEIMDMTILDEIKLTRAIRVLKLAIEEFGDEMEF